MSIFYSLLSSKAFTELYPLSYSFVGAFLKLIAYFAIISANVNGLGFSSSYFIIGFNF